MLINGINYLPLVKMGLDETGDRCGDIHNYRVRTPGEIIPGKNGRIYFLEFSRWDAWRYRTENKRTGKPLKKPICETVLKNALYLDTQFSEGYSSYRDLNIEKKTNSSPVLYSQENILKVANKISKEKFDKILFVQYFEITIKPGENFTPRAVIHEYAQNNRLEEKKDKYGNYFIKICDKYYKYSFFNRNGEKTTIYLQEA